MATPSQPFFQPPASQSKPQVPFPQNALGQNKVHAVIDVSTLLRISCAHAHPLSVQRVKFLKQAGFTEENSPELARMVTILKAMAQQRESSVLVPFVQLTLNTREIVCRSRRGPPNAADQRALHVRSQNQRQSRAQRQPSVIWSDTDAAVPSTISIPRVLHARPNQRSACADSCFQAHLP